MARRAIPTRGGIGWLGLPSYAFLLVFFVVPTALLLRLSFFDSGGEFSLGHFSRLLGTPSYFGILLNTFSIALWSSIVTLLLAYPVAYVMSRVQGSMRAILVGVVLIPFWTSILIRTFAWMIVLGRNGVLRSTLSAIGLPLDLDLIYNHFAVLVSISHALLPVAVMTMYAVMVSIDRNLERAAATLGAGRAHSFWRIYFPLSFPGVATSGLILFISALGYFVQPALLGGPAQTMIAQSIIVQIDETLNWGFASAIAVVLLVLSVALIFVFDRIFGMTALSGAQGRTTAATSGRRRGAMGRLGLRLASAIGWIFTYIGEARDAAFGRRGGGKASGGGKGLRIVVFAILVFALLPSLFLIPISFSTGSSFQWPPQGFSLRWYEAYLASPVWQQATVRSLWIGLCTAVLSMLIGVPAALAMVRGTNRLGSLSLTYTMLPLVVPNIIVALALFYFFASIGWVGTSYALVIGHTVFALPYVVLTLMATLKNYDTRLDDAAATLGAPPGKVLTRVTFPIIKVGLLSAFLFGFVRSFDELTVALFLAGGLNNTLPKQMWADAHYNVSPLLAAVSTVVLISIVVILSATEYFSYRSRKRFG